VSIWDHAVEIDGVQGTAKYYDFDAGYLLEMEPDVRHYEVFPESSLAS
jgi:hypothetical protein